MRLALFTDAFADRPLATALDWLELAAPEVRDLELGAGGYSPAPHCHLATLLECHRARRKLLRALDERGFRLSALNAAGNPLHPDPAVAAAHDGALRDTIRLAAVLGVDRVVAMSGCPGAGPDDRRAPHFAGGGWSPGEDEIRAWQWRERLEPYWRDVCELARREHPGLRICVELEPGALVYNVATFERLCRISDQIAVNLDPSHLFWQGMDPVTIAARLGPHLGWAHAKDTTRDVDVTALQGVLSRSDAAAPEELPWTYATVGHGHPVRWWRRWLAELRLHGYNGVISIEHEDPRASPEAGVSEGARLLAGAMRDVEVPA
jgi:sugar phosphate isomerase/epimerase